MLQIKLLSPIGAVNMQGKLELLIQVYQPTTVEFEGMWVKVSTNFSPHML